MTIKLKAGLAEPGPVYICHGATGEHRHTFRMAAMEDSPWSSHSVSLNASTAESLPIGVEPDLGEYQKLDSQTEWKLSCPNSGTDRDFEVWVQSEFTAAPYRIPMRLGHYRREILHSRPPISAPVLGDQITAEITVGSFYTKELVEGIDVEWWMGEEKVETVPTSTSGMSQFIHTVGTVGEQTITAKVHNPYDNTVVEKSFLITVYAQNPWKDVTLWVNSKKVEWDAGIILLRGQLNEVRVEAPPTIAEELKLTCSEDGGLNIDASPNFGEGVKPVSNTFNWKLTPGADRSGRILLVFRSEKVEQPWERSTHVISSNLVDEVEEVIVSDYGPPLPPSADEIFFRNEPRTVTLTYKPGSPLSDFPLELTGTVLTGTPILKVDPSGAHAWSVNANTGSGTFRLELKGDGFTQGITLPECKVLSRNLADEVEVRVSNYSPPSAPDIFFRNEPRTVTLTYKPGSPLAGNPLELTGSVLTGTPILNVAPSGAHTWSVNASISSGTFRLKVNVDGFTQGITLPECKVLSRNLADEVEVRVSNYSPPSAPDIFFRNEPRTVTLTYKPGSPLAGNPLELTGSVLTGTPILNVAPSGAHTWSVNANTRSGTFRLELKGDGFARGITLPEFKVMARHLQEEADVLINGIPIPSDGTRFYQKKDYVVTLRPKPGSPLAGYPVKLRVTSSSLSASFRSAPEFDKEQSEHRWTVAGSHAFQMSSTFFLSFAGEGMVEDLVTPTCVLW